LLDADDRLSPTYLAEVSLAFADESISFAYTDVTLFGDQSGIGQYKPFQIVDWAYGQPILGCSPFRRAVWEHIGGFSEAEELRIGNEDYDFWIAVVAAGYRGIHIAKPLYEYRQTKRSMMNTLNIKFYITTDYMANRHYAFLKKHGIYETFICSGYQRSALNIFKTNFYRDAVPLAQRALSLGSTNRLISYIAKLKQIHHALWPFIRWLIITYGALSKYWNLFVQRFK